MEEKLLELFKLSTEYAQKSKENYMEIRFDYKKIEIGIRKKDSFEYLEDINFYLKHINLDDVIKKLKLLVKEEENG